MREEIIKIKQALDHDQPSAAKNIASRILKPKNVRHMMPATINEVRALLGWALILLGETEEARKLISPMVNQERPDRTARAAWKQIISDEIEDPNSNNIRWLEESTILWSKMLENNPEDPFTKEALKEAQTKHAALLPEWYARQMRLVNEESERRNGSIIAS